jgi:hypothetical protein
MERAGALFAVAQQAAAIEPLTDRRLLAARPPANALRIRRPLEPHGRRCLVDPSIDVARLIDTTTILAAAETYLLINRLTGWDLDTYQDWLAATCITLATDGS